MLEIKKIAAIDIGSNAIRLLISNVIISEDREPQFKKSSLVRVPIRLGADAFVGEGIISQENIQRMIAAIEAEKFDGEWIYEELYVIIKETQEKINLLDQSLEGI